MIMISTENSNINYEPKNKIEDVIRNVYVILCVFKEEQPLNRDFGIDSTLIDKNFKVVENRIMSHLLDVFRKYEPRAILKNVRLYLKEDNDFDIEVRIEVI